MLLFLAIPVVALLYHAPSSLFTAFESEEGKQAIAVSLRTTSASLLLILVFGTPVAVLLGQSNFPGRGLVEAIVEAPIVLPPAAAGIGLLLGLGRNGLIHTELPFTVGAVVVAQTFVSAPLYIRPLAAALRSLDSQWRDAAALDGASASQAMLRVVLPMVRPTVVSGGLIAWARSLGEFGATILFAGNLAGKTQTLPLAIYMGLESNLDQATGLSVLLLLAAFAVLVSVGSFETRRGR